MNAPAVKFTPELTFDDEAPSVVLTNSHLQAARQVATQSGQHLLDALEEQSECRTPESFTAALGLWMQYPTFGALQLHEMRPDFDLLAFADATKYESVALRNLDGELYIVIANPFDHNVIAKIDLLLQERCVWGIAHRKDILAFLAHFEADLSAMDGLQAESPLSENSRAGIEDISLKSISEDASPVVKLLRSTLYDAFKAGTSDIHLETDVDGLVVRYRIDGVLSTIANVTGLLQAEQVISRIKVMSELDISERRVPQDGRFKVLVQGREVDVRVSIIPTVFGEDAVLRILDRKAVSEKSGDKSINGKSKSDNLSLDVLGFDPAIMQRFRQLAEEPYGMLLVTGPTGSGKTTTLYGIISEINSGQDKIITIEDPVEYQLAGVMQIPVNEKKGLTFARGLRSILRHDPDKIMVGEIRDSETAQIAVQSALTGHLVLTTVHANNVFDVIGRFTNMNVDPYSFVSAINGILAQRLVRIICPYCAVEEQPDQQLIEKSGLTVESVKTFNFRIGRGCGQCHGTGYKGRKAIAELLCFNDEIRELIVTKEPVRRIKEAARLNGTRSMREAALALVKNGETTLQEINRVTSIV